MGLFEKKTDSIRKAMRRTYENHYKKALAGTLGTIASDSPHAGALFGTLGTRNLVCGFPADELMLWAELGPFLELEGKESLEVLCEYAVWRELESDIEHDRYLFLSAKLNYGVEKMIQQQQASVVLKTIDRNKANLSNL